MSPPRLIDLVGKKTQGSREDELKTTNRKVLKHFHRNFRKSINTEESMRDMTQNTNLFFLEGNGKVMCFGLSRDVWARVGHRPSGASAAGRPPGSTPLPHPLTQRIKTFNTLVLVSFSKKSLVVPTTILRCSLARICTGGGGGGGWGGGRGHPKPVVQHAPMRLRGERLRRRAWEESPKMEALFTQQNCESERVCIDQGFWTFQPFMSSKCQNTAKL